MSHAQPAPSAQPDPFDGSGLPLHLSSSAGEPSLEAARLTSRKREGITRLNLVPKNGPGQARCLLVALHDSGSVIESVSQLMSRELSGLEFTCDADAGPFDLVWALGVDARDGGTLSDLRSSYPEARLVASGRQILAHEHHLRSAFGVDRLVAFPAPAVRLRRVLLEEFERGRRPEASS